MANLKEYVLDLERRTTEALAAKDIEIAQSQLVIDEPKNKKADKPEAPATAEEVTMSDDDILAINPDELTDEEGVPLEGEAKEKDVAALEAKKAKIVEGRKEKK